jgi:hypothetical protein
MTFPYPTAVQAAVARYRSRLGDDDRAQRTDPTYNYQWRWLVRMLETADMAMEDEGVDRSSRERVIRTILYGAPDPVEADRRIDQQQRLVEEMRTRPLGPIVVPADPGRVPGWHPPDMPPEPPSRSLRDRLRGNDRPIRLRPSVPGEDRWPSGE